MKIQVIYWNDAAEDWDAVKFRNKAAAHRAGWRLHKDNGTGFRSFSEAPGMYYGERARAAGNLDFLKFQEALA
jgi:hypothetical protein